jgi:thiol-disulfide isomerase/thioredoxin
MSLSTRYIGFTAMAITLICIGCGGEPTAADEDSAAGHNSDALNETSDGDALGGADDNGDGEATSDDATEAQPTEDVQADVAPPDSDPGAADTSPPETDSATAPDDDAGPIVSPDSDAVEPTPSPDMDGDGIPDDEDPDMDGDGYSNDDEMHAGTDPADANSVIYTGGWPYNANKEDIVDPGWDSEPLLGTVMPNYQALDQHGDLVSLYDFANTGKPIVLDVVTWFCEPCKAMADYFSNGDPSVMDDFAFFADKYDIIRDLVVNGDVHWITIIWSGGTPVEQADAALWEETWPSEFVTVLADIDLQLQEYLYVKAMPRIDVLDEHMTFVAFCDNDVPCDSELGGGPGGPVTGLKWLESYHKSFYNTP